MTIHRAHYHTFQILISLCVFALLLDLPVESYAQNRAAIDVKTSFSGKVEFAPVEVGTTVCLNQSDWATVTEVGEDYSLWLKEYERIKEGNETRAEITLELRTPAFLRSGSLIETRQVTATFRTQSDGMPLPDTLHWDREDLKALREAIAGELSESANDLKLEALIVGGRVCQAARSLVEQAR